jgi:hypothetical protein
MKKEGVKSFYDLFHESRLPTTFILQDNDHHEIHAEKPFEIKDHPYVPVDYSDVTRDIEALQSSKNYVCIDGYCTVARAFRVIHRFINHEVTQMLSLQFMNSFEIKIAPSGRRFIIVDILKFPPNRNKTQIEFGMIVPENSEMSYM